MREVAHRICKYCEQYSYSFDTSIEEEMDRYLLSYGKHLEEAHPQEWTLLNLEQSYKGK